jgi:nucleotide-binding universal stress UspA family protein
VVLVAYDGSPAARQAVLDAADLLGRSQMLVVTVWEEGLGFPAPTPAEGLTMAPRVEPEMALEVDHRVHAIADQVAEEGAALATSLGLEAQPLAVPAHGGIAATILTTAHEHHAAAIVVGSRGLSGLLARLEGSTTKHLLKHADCPVLVVHEAAHDKD